MSETRYAPIPWKARAGQSVINLVDANGNRFGAVSTVGYWQEVSGTDINTAAFLVNAVNCHDELLEALTACEAILPRYRLAGATPSHDEELDHVLERARAAISKATGEPVEMREARCGEVILGGRIKPEIVAALREWAAFEQDGGNVEQGAAIDIILDWYDAAIAKAAREAS